MSTTENDNSQIAETKSDTKKDAQARRSTKLRKKAMIMALEKSLGIVTTACLSTGVTRETHYKWMREDPEYAKAVEDISEIALDFAENKLIQRIKSGNNSDACLIFYLKCKGKKRGYVEKSELSLTDDSIEVDFSR